MADNTRNQMHIREIEERLNTRMEEWFMDIGASLQCTIEDIFWRHKNSCSSGSGASSLPYSCNTRLARLDFPRFNGEGVKNRIIQCDTFFSVDQTPEEYKVHLDVVHFEGKALQWNSAYVKNMGLDKLPSWNDYTKILIERFGEVCEDPMAELMRLWQKGTVTDYHTEFDAIVSRIDLSEANQLSCFLGGLQMEIQMMVRMFQPTFVMKAFSLAKMYENANATSMEAKPLSKTLKPNPVTKPPLLPNPPKTLEPMKPKTQTTK